MDPAKVKAVLEWKTPRSLRDVQCFLGFAYFYRKFIQDYSKIILPLTQLTKKEHAFLWSNEADMAFRHLKEAFTSAPILAQNILGEIIIGHMILIGIKKSGIFKSCYCVNYH